LLPLLLHVACHSQALGVDPSSSASSGGNRNSYSSNTAAAAACSSESVAVPPLAAQFVKFVTALEAALRAASEAKQSGTLSTIMFADTANSIGSLCAVVLLPGGEDTNTVLIQHMGLCGPVALAQEQQQLYSLLSTLQKLRCCLPAAGQWGCGERMAASCCLAAGHTAVELLAMALVPAASIGGSAAPEQQSQSPPSSAAAAGATAAAAQPAVTYLPSLVIFGRCLLQWAQQLQQQAPELPLLGSGDQQHRQHWGTLMYEHGAARVCIPGLREGSAITPWEQMESLVATVCEWADGIDPPAQAQLAAAGCPPQQLQQQLEALLSAQQDTQQGLTDASLAALVQQLQQTGAMLNSIAVPNFCNNLACANLSGPTEVRLVSGRSCVCAGCRVARYCGRDCQRAAWKQHKLVCKAVAAAGATAATAGGT
jgi:hypothetical protein